MIHVLIILILLAAEPLPPADLPTASMVALPANVQPGQVVHVSIAVQADGAPSVPVVQLGTSPALRITAATPYVGSCVPDGAAWRCELPVAPAAPNKIDVTIQVSSMPCARIARVWASVNDWPGDAEWLTILDPSCQVYLPLASQQGY